MDSQKTSVGAKIVQTSSNHGELFGVVGKAQVILVKTGEDIVSKIMNLSQQGPMKICVHSATGGICNVTLQESATGGGIVTYEGQFFIISLSGSVMLSKSSRTCDLSVMLSRSDHIVLGGCVAGKLIAATPVQVVLSSFIPEKEKPESKGDDDAPKGIRIVDPPGSCVGN
ncbi:AT-hook motif nuclear-localized protein 10-like [Solanum lycopersicum]|uniref:AT-hook motif nuclear-localized protein n=1 Tax=Solanum lycopersicum TaxID=4081 RepID=A0A3Q7G577_SOLLC|nr:AT-hook motif nuclear-localized protein 10-like [Solanum lycopersicum]